MANEKVTELPTVSNALPQDIIYAVQAGVSVQETLQQVLDLILDSVVLNFAGDPNGNVAGDLYVLCWDTTDNILYICTTAGSVSTAVWKPCIGQLTNGQLRIGSTGAVPAAATITAGSNISVSNGAGSITISATGTASFDWTEVTGVSQAMAVNSGYIANNGATVTFTLPTTAAVGDQIAVIGSGAGGWAIAQNASQIIHVGSSATTTGVGGSVASTNRYDAIFMVCIVANLEFSMLGAPQGILTVV